MHTTLELIDLAKERLAIDHALTLPMSDYRLAQLLDLDQRTVSNWRQGRSHIGAQFAPRFSDATGLPVEYVFACIEHERADSDEARSVLERIARRFAEASTTASVLLAACALLAAPNLLRAGTIPSTEGLSVNPPVYTLCALAARRRGLREALQLLFSLIRSAGFSPLT